MGDPKNQDDDLIPPHGGYRNLKSYQLTKVIHDITVRFTRRYIHLHSRTCDQMEQAARSGKQNLAEGSEDSATSKKMELKLTGVSKGSLEELRLDYEDYLRQHGLPQWEPDHPALMRFKARRCASLEDFRLWIGEEFKRKDTDPHGLTRTHTDKEAASVYAANGILSLLNLCIYFVDRQMKSQAKAFEEEGGFTERLYRRRMETRRKQKDKLAE